MIIRGIDLAKILEIKHPFYLTVTYKYDIFELWKSRNVPKIQGILSLIDLWNDVSEDLDIVRAFESLGHH